MYKGFFIFFFIAVVISLFFSCSSSKNNGKYDVLNDTVISEEQQFAFDYEFFEADRYKMNGDLDMAISKYNTCLSINPNSAVVHYNLATVYINKKDFQAAERHSEKAVSLNANNIWYLNLSASLSMQSAKYDNAIRIFKIMIELSPKELDFYLNLADAYLKNKDFGAAIDTYQLVEKNFGISESISLQKHSIYVALNNKKAALNELQKLADAYNNELRYKRLIADFYLRTDELDKAMIIYSDLIKANDNDGYSHLGLSECYRIKGKTDLSISELKMAFKSPEIPSSDKVNLLVNFLNNIGSSTELRLVSYELAEIMVKMYPDDPDVNALYANFLLQNKLYKEAREYIINVLKVRKDKYELWEQLILIDYELKDWNSIYFYSSEALEYFPNQSFLYFFNGFSSFQLEKFNDAIKALEFGYKLIPKDDPIKNDFLSLLADSYYKMDLKEKAFNTYEELLVLDGDNLGVKNNYAYYLSVGNINLEKAEAMSKSTILAEPKNSTYLDTYAWVLFKMKRYSEALTYIFEAVKYNTDSSAVIVEHYGDILFHNGKLEEAVIQWNKAKLLGKGSDLLDEKISNKNYIE